MSALALWFLLGLCMGLLYFYSLWRSTQLLGSGVPAYFAARGAWMVVALVLISLRAGPGLLLVTCGILTARTAVLYLSSANFKSFLVLFFKKERFVLLSSL